MGSQSNLKEAPNGRNVVQRAIPEMMIKIDVNARIPGSRPHPANWQVVPSAQAEAPGHHYQIMVV